MRLMTWNVLWRFHPDWRARERGILSLLSDQQPDVLGLQECWRTDDTSQADVIAAHLGRYGAFIDSPLPPVPTPPEHPEQRGVTMGIGVVSRWPILDVRSHTLPGRHRPLPSRALEARIVDGTGVPFDILVAATEWEPEFADDHIAQTQELADLITRGEHGVSRFLLADLNCDASQNEFAPLAAVADDTWELGGGDPDVVTLSSAVPFAPLEATKEMDRRVDHILVRRPRAVTVERAFTIDSPVGGIYPSDHFPVIADVTLPT